MNNILITGSKGQLGSEFRALSAHYPGITMTFTDIEELDITSETDVASYIKAGDFNAVINCAAYTAVDKAETEPEIAYKVNALAAANLAKASASQKITLIHISTDYVFDGTNHRPYKETDPVKPAGSYGLTKLQGEEEIMRICQNAVIIRTSWLYSCYGNNFVKTILRLASERENLGIVFDQIGTPTYAADLAAMVLNNLSHFLKTNKPTLYHFSNEGVASWYDFAHLIVKLSGLTCKVRPILSKEYPTPAARPHFSVLDKSKIKSTLNIEIPDWQDSLQVCLNKLQEMNKN
ncbi:MAG: dTDP-4-dehydrorhamnose reductase [Bacteroidota bacterium]